MDMHSNQPRLRLAAPPLCVGHADLYEEADVVQHSQVSDRAALHDAVDLCLLCPARRSCVTSALVEEGHGEPRLRYSVRGGFTSSERWSIHKTLCGQHSPARIEEAA